MIDSDWTEELDEAFNMIEKQSNLGKQILKSMEPQKPPEEGDWIEVKARWGKSFVEMPNPLLGDNHFVRFYFEQPQRKPLTDEEILNEYCGTPNIHQFISAFKAGVRFAESVHGIKENT